jgi:glutamate/tyrosine decarboxylase-like PLP-dependent enzyme
MAEPISFPEHRTTPDELRDRIAKMRTEDADWRGGRTFSLVYNVGDPQLEQALHDTANEYLHENALNPFKFPSLLRMEREIVAMAADLFHGDPRAGSLSSGGTESIFLAVSTARSWFRAQHGNVPCNIVTVDTAHPAFAKACHYLDVEQRRVPHGADLRADVDAMAAACDGATAMVVGSAPCYPFGTIDPIPALAAVARERGILCHVDACLGGWLLPWWERLGEPVPPWDFRVDGVTSISADIHKYGYAFKGASSVLYREKALLEHQYFIYDQWPGGLYASSTTAGTRPAAPMAGAWAAITTLGADGYLEHAARIRDTTRRMQAGIDAIGGLQVTGDPDLSVFQFSSDVHDIFAIGDVMDDRGWHLDRQQGGLHVMVFPGHDAVVDQFLEDLAFAVANHGEARDIMAVYGAVDTETA